MVVNSIHEHLTSIGLSEYESRTYITLLSNEPTSAYEVAKLAGIPTSKIYEVLARLNGKGIVTTVERDSGNRYIPIDPKEFIDTRRQMMDATLDILSDGLGSIASKAPDHTARNLEGAKTIITRAEHLINNAKETLVMSMFFEEAATLRPALKAAQSRGVKMATVLFGIERKPIGTTYTHPIAGSPYTQSNERALVIVSDSSEALSATFKGEEAEGLISGNRGFVTMAEDYLRHDIYMMKITKRFDPILRSRFGNHYEMLRDIFSDSEKNPT
jgi:sugar-specific transcriptional regulator TrmB